MIPGLTQLIHRLIQNHWFLQAAALEAAGLQPNLLPEPEEPAEDIVFGHFDPTIRIFYHPK